MTARDRLVHSTIDLMRRHGVAGTGVAEILDHGRVSRRSIYLNFPDGKAGLVDEATRVAGAYIDNRIALCSDAPTPVGALEAFIGDWKAVVSGSGFTAGCPVTAAAMSRSNIPSASDLAGDAFRQWTVTISASLRGHGIADPAATALANTVVAAVSGAIVISVAQRSLDALNDVETQMSMLIDHQIALGSLPRTDNAEQEGRTVSPQTGE
ncbi:TetR/AcrR family transcriptional regulator [Rhodococcus sp. IEGM 1381]|uniref:TetR/AcrR family transcriptional regulator n=1 Tax=Rhodococcus sp. IEGM 1381 TaxID=3047085 RepID=UPI0024B63C33|nr:TetR/AcrR family transcriptional regulator [Rhodococcus sp. IEGM 1381]MDI9897384.1 TetR/AcrR family transcriptional regulator [Rhodococcus sp. IEGM 1381]